MGLLIGSSPVPAALEDWQLPTSNFVSTDITGMLPEIIAPRPDAERGTYSAYDWAYPGILYERPIVIQGGSYPFRCEIIATGGTADTSGLTIGSETLTLAGSVFTRPDNYCVVEWTPAVGDEGETFSYTVRVTDQDGNIATVTVGGGTVQASQFIFYDSTDTGSTNTGTLAEPYNSWTTAFGTLSTTSNNAGSIVYFRTGDHAVTGFTNTADRFRVTATKPLSYMNYPGESPELDLSTGIIEFEPDDFWLSGINIHDNNNSDSVGRMITYWTGMDRSVVWRNTFTDYFVGVDSGNNNPAILWLSSTARSYTTILSNTLEGSIGTFVQSYDTRDMVVEDNITGATSNQNQPFDASSHALIWLKQSPQRVSVRANTMRPNTLANTGLNSIGIGGGGIIGFDDVEICWNKTIHPTVTGRRGSVFLFVSAANSLPRDNLNVFRNSIDGRIVHDAGPGPTTTSYVGRNILTNQVVLDDGEWNAVDNIESESGAFDINGDLTGTTRTNYLGTHGAEIAP